MKSKRALRNLALCAGAVLSIGLFNVINKYRKHDAQYAPTPQAPGEKQKRKLDVHYVGTPQALVEKMLEMAQLSKDDVIYDLGCGDGRIVITAAKKYGARGVGVDLDPQRIKESNENAKKAGVTDRVKFFEQDLFEMDFREATVVALYLLPALNLKLRPKLLRELKPGTRIVSFAFDMGDWKPDKVFVVTADDGKFEVPVYCWIVPAGEIRKN